MLRAQVIMDLAAQAVRQPGRSWRVGVTPPATAATGTSLITGLRSKPRPAVSVHARYS